MDKYEENEILCLWVYLKKICRLESRDLISHSWTSTHCSCKDRLLMCSNLLSPAVPSFGPWCWFSSSWHLKSQSDPFCPIALTMCSDTCCAEGGSHRSSGITMADQPALTQQCGGGCIQNSDPFLRVGLRPRVGGSDWPSGIRLTCPIRKHWLRGWEKLQGTICIKF